MPRLGLSVSESFDRRPSAPKPDPYGRRPRRVEAVRIAGEDRTPSLFSPVFIKLTASLAVIAAVAVSIAAWRLFTFPH